MRRRLAGAAAALVLVGAAWWALRPPAAPDTWTSVHRPPVIRPDYTDLVVPPNLAPLNFVIREPGRAYVVRIHGGAGDPIEVRSESPEVRLPPSRWRSLLEANRGSGISFDVWARDAEGRWSRYETLTNTVAEEEIDPVLVYRHILPTSYFPNRMGIYQRHLESFDEERVLDAGGLGEGCVNCHAFVGNRPDRMLIGVRSKQYGSSALLVDAGRVEKIGTRLGYTSWHPSGRLAAYSINRVRQFFHLGRPELHDVVDLDSTLAWYSVEDRAVATAPALSHKDELETYPTWAPDGRHLYFCTAPIPWEDRKTTPPKGYEGLKYSLVRVPFDPETGRWGERETGLAEARGQQRAVRGVAHLVEQRPLDRLLQQALRGGVHPAVHQPRGPCRAGLQALPPPAAGPRLPRLDPLDPLHAGARHRPGSGGTPGADAGCPLPRPDRGGRRRDGRDAERPSRRRAWRPPAAPVSVGASSSSPGARGAILAALREHGSSRSAAGV